MDWIYYGVVLFAWTLGGFISGVTAMGCSLVALPILTLVMPPDRAVLICCVCSGLIPAMLVPFYYRGVILKEISILLGASIPGSILGVLLFESISGRDLRLALAGMLGFFVLWQTIGKKSTFRLHSYRWAAFPAGFLGGLVNALTGVPGAIIGVYATLRIWTKENILSMQNTFFALSSLLTVSILAYRGMYSWDIFFDIGCAAPGMLLGIGVSLIAQRYISTALCRCFLLSMLAVSSILLFYHNI